MSTPRWHKIKELVDAALDLEPAERAAYLDAACPDADLRTEVESLLAHDTPGFMERPAAADFGSGEGPAQQAPATDLTGELIGHYRVEGKLGRGGMGEVYLAQDQELDRRVALKLLGEDLQRDESAAQRFFREARSAAALDHPYICKIFEIGQAAERPFIAMEYVAGETLGDRIEAQPLSLDEALRIADEIAEALAAAHGAHIVHRDLKPSNIMLTVGGHVKVLDFGLAKRVASAGHDQFETASRHTATGVTLGTLAHMAPEQLRGQPIDARADIFAFGILLFEMLTGKHPFERATPMDSAAAILTDEAPPPSRYLRDAPPLLDEVVATMLAKDTGARYADAGVVRTELARVVAMRRGAPAGAGGADDAPPTRIQRGPDGQAGAAPSTGAPGAMDAVAADASRFGLPQPRGGRLAAATIAAAVLAATLWGIGSIAPRLLDGRVPPSVAVLPLTFLGDDPNDEYWAEGVGLAVAARLSRAGVRVASVEATRPYAGDSRPADALARELGVDAVLTGGFRIDDDIRVTPTLTRADGEVAWRDTLVVPWQEVADVETDLAVAVAEALVGNLGQDVVGVLSTAESTDIDAYDNYLAGVSYLLQQTTDTTDVSTRYFLDATELDPALVNAYAAAGTAYAALYDYGRGGVEILNRAGTQLAEAVNLDPGNVWALRAATAVDMYRGNSEQNLARAAAAAELTADYDVAALLMRAQGLATAGLIDASLPLIERAIDLEPTNEMPRRFAVIAAAWKGDYEGAIAAGEEYLARFGDELEVRTYLALAHDALGRDAGDHYRAATDLARLSGSAAGAAARAFLYAGMYFRRQEQPAVAQRLWREQSRRIEEAMAEDSADNPGVLLYRAMFELLLGQRPPGERPPELALRRGFVPYQVTSLAATYAHIDDVDAAAELLAEALRLGSSPPQWRLYVGVAAPEAWGSPAMQAFVRDFDERVRVLEASF